MSSGRFDWDIPLKFCVTGIPLEWTETKLEESLVASGIAGIGLVCVQTHVKRLETDVNLELSTGDGFIVFETKEGFIKFENRIAFSRKIQLNEGIVLNVEPNFREQDPVHVQIRLQQIHGLADPGASNANGEFFERYRMMIKGREQLLSANYEQCFGHFGIGNLNLADRKGNLIDSECTLELSVSTKNHKELAAKERSGTSNEDVVSVITPVEEVNPGDSAFHSSTEQYPGTSRGNVASIIAPREEVEPGISAPLSHFEERTGTSKIKCQLPIWCIPPERLVIVVEEVTPIFVIGIHFHWNAGTVSNMIAGELDCEVPFAALYAKRVLGTKDGMDPVRMLIPQGEGVLIFHDMRNHQECLERREFIMPGVQPHRDGTPKHITVDVMTNVSRIATAIDAYRAEQELKRGMNEEQRILFRREYQLELFRSQEVLFGNQQRYYALQRDGFNFEVIQRFVLCLPNDILQRQ